MCEEGNIVSFLYLHFTGSDRKIKCLAQVHTIYDSANEKHRIQANFEPRLLFAFQQCPHWDDFYRELMISQFGWWTRNSAVTGNCGKVEELTLTGQKIKLLAHGHILQDSSSKQISVFCFFMKLKTGGKTCA